MGTHPIFESDFDCLTENLFHPDLPAETRENQLKDHRKHCSPRMNRTFALEVYLK